MLPWRRHFGCTVSSRHDSGRSLESPESQCSSIGFQPVSCPHHRMAFSKLPPSLGDVYEAQGFQPISARIMRGASMGRMVFVPEGLHDRSQARSALAEGREDKGGLGRFTHRSGLGFSSGLQP